MAEHGGPSVSEQGAGWESGAAGLLHLLLHQLHAHPAWPAPAGGEALGQRYGLALALTAVIQIFHFTDVGI